MICAGYSNRKRSARAAEVLTQVNLSDRMDHWPISSLVDSVNVSTARALVNKPSIILADEPTGNLDSKTSEIMKLLTFTPEN
jgi:putative ABC transport system ATP-binding protein